MIPESLLTKLVETIHSEPSLKGSAIGYYGNNQCRMLHPGRNSSKVVIVEEIVPGKSEERSASVKGTSSSGGGSQQILSTPPPIVTNRSVIGREAVGAGLSCGMAVVSGVAVFGGAAAAPASGGASTFLVVAAWTGFVTSGIQCINGIVRVGTILADPNDNDLQRWDENTLYSVTSLMVDALGLASSLVALPAATKSFWQALQTHGKMKQGFEAVSKLDRAARSKLVRDALKTAVSTPEGKKAVEAALKETALTNKQVATVLKVGANTGSRSRVVMGALSKQSASKLQTAIKDLLLGAPAGFAVSATPPDWTGSGSGVVYKFGSWAGPGLGNIVVHVMDK